MVHFFQNDVYLQLMDCFNINDIESLTGIKAHTLRIWEKRYNFYTPKRKESNHRYYDNDDLKYILKIAYLYNNGYKISKIAALNKEEINKLNYYSEQNVNAEQLFINRLLQYAFEFNQEDFEDTLNDCIESFGLEKSMLKIVYPYFEKVGLLWMNDIAVPAQEHFSSNIIRNKIIRAIDNIKHKGQDVKKPLLLFLPEGEYHEIPLLFTSYLLKKFGKPFIYCGANTTLEELKAISAQTNIDELYFHLITNFTGRSIDDYISLLIHTFPSKKILMSGPLAFKVTLKSDNCLLLTSLARSLNYIKKGLASQYQVKEY
jgi:MerR family transcriptional regulator, light-induced transcriptional regulator